MTSFARLLNATVCRTVPRGVRDSLNRWFPGLRERWPLVPFMQPEEIRCVESYLRPHFTMLEFGCGGSTLHFSRRVKTYHAVEHDRSWYEKIRPRVPGNVRLLHVAADGPPADAPRTASSWDELPASSRSAEFAAYVSVPEDRIRETLDAVLIDGRARPECARAVLPWLAPEGVVFIHDFWHRPHYHVVLERYEVIERLDRSAQTLAVLRPRDPGPA
jgi:hypothetical protein